jgi:hypothetical protein
VYRVFCAVSLLLCCCPTNAQFFRRGATESHVAMLLPHYLGQSIIRARPITSHSHLRIVELCLVTPEPRPRTSRTHIIIHDANKHSSVLRSLPLLVLPRSPAFSTFPIFLHALKRYAPMPPRCEPSQHPLMVRTYACVPTALTFSIHRYRQERLPGFDKECLSCNT